MPPAKPALLSCEDVTKTFGARPLFDGMSFSLHDGDHVGVVGPNGSGKSTFLKLLAGFEPPDTGSRTLRKLARVGYVPQTPDFEPGLTVHDVLIGALAGELLEEYEKAGMVAETLGRAGFDDPHQRVETLSGGWKKRLAIAREWVCQPDVLLMDEPTNHLDLEGILWLEALLKSDPRAFMVVSHDRYFLESTATRILEIDRRYPGGRFEVKGNYTDFLVKRDEELKNQSAYQDALANRVRREIEWLRRGPQGRQTKQKARIQAAGGLIDELADSRDRSRERTASIAFSGTDRRTRKLLEAKGLAKAFGERQVIRGVDILISPGTRLGLLGQNGSGKTTLLKLLEGALAPDSGTLDRADGLRVVHFAQDRSSLDLSATLRRALAPNGDTVIFQDRPLHVASWAKRFLFSTEQLELPVGRLSGGEQARLLIARLMLLPADLLILDEPTNDLDIPTLDVLEESLLEFKGGLVLVTHDRYLLDRVSTELLALDGKGGTRYFADYDQWLAAQKAAADEDAPTNNGKAQPQSQPPRKAAGAPKLTYREKQEWDAMEQRILEAESRLEDCQAAVADPAVASNAGALQERFAALQEAQTEVERLYQRWAELEAKLAPASP